MIAITFCSLITDTQWDMFYAIGTAANIDIVNNKFNYKSHQRNAFKLLGILFLSSVLMVFIFFNSYNLNIGITLIFIGFDIIRFLSFAIYKIQTCYLQIEYSSLKITSNNIFSSISRFLIALIKNPYCTGIGQLFSALYLLITVNIMFKKNFYIDSCGNVIKKLN